MKSDTPSDSGEARGPQREPWSPQETERRIERLQEDSARIRSQMDRVAGFFEGPDGVWVRLQGIEDAQKDIRELKKDMRELKDEVGKLNSTRNKVIGGCVAVSATIALLIAILRLLPADPPVIQNILPPSGTFQQTPEAAAPSAPPKSTS